MNQYQKEIDGYTYVATRVDGADEDSTEIKNLYTVSYYTYYGVYYTAVNGETTPWLTNYNTRTGNIYFVYEQAGLKIKDNIINDGSLEAVYKGDASLEGATYEWLKSEDKSGNYATVEKKNYQGGASNLSEDGKLLYPAYDEGARKWYKVKITFATGEFVESQPFLVTYYDELQNGSFETPTINTFNYQYTNSDYLNSDGIWQSTGENSDKGNVAIEIVREGTRNGKNSYSWVGDWNNAAPDGKQFAELNCEAAGALYQDVLTMEGTSLNYWLQHRARGLNQNWNEEYDTMYLVIMPTQTAINKNLTTQNTLSNYLATLGVHIDEKHNEVNSEHGDIAYNQDGILVVRVTSNDQAWHYISGTNYVPTTSLTRFFFVAGDTASNDNTVGNFLDNVGFSQDLPPVEDDEFSIELKKEFVGLDDSSLQTVMDNIEFKITVKEGDRELNEEDIKTLFGITSTTIQGSELTPNPDGSLTLTIANRKISTGKTYEVTITENNAELESFEMSAESQTDIATGNNDPVQGEKVSGTVATFTISGKKTIYTTFTNTYERNEKKNIHFTKKWDDANNQFNTRPESLEVTLKPTITVSENGQLNEIELTGNQLGIQLNQTLTGENWSTVWKNVPVYYTYNGAKVKIDYTVVEGSIDSGYVYEATSDEALSASENGEIDYTGTFNPGEIAQETDTSNQSVTSRAKAATASAKTMSVTENAETNTLGEPAHNKYIEYDASSGEYTLNLDVTGAKGEASGVDVLFVIDTSGSMGIGWGNQYNNLLPTVKTLLTGDNGIIDQIFENPDNVNSVAYVSFAGKSETKTSGWYQTNTANQLKTSINSLKATGGTNWTYAMQKASSALAQKANSGNDKVVIFLSDGAPTYSIDNRGREYGYGSSTVEKYYTEAISVVKNSSYFQNAEMFSVYLTNGTKDGMEKFSEGTGASLVNGSSDLSTALKEILKIIIPTYTNVTIRDTLSDYVDFVGNKTTVTKRAANGNETTLSGSDYTVTRNDKTITVELLNGGELEEGATYTVSFKVKPNDEANKKFAESGYGGTVGDPGTGATSAGKEGFHSNTEATVSYTVNGDDDSVEYPMPVVQVTTHNLTFTKVWKHPDNVSNPTGDVTLYVTFTDGTYQDITLEATTGYTKTLNNVPVTKNIATVVETSHFDDYEPSYQISADGTSATITNNYSKLTTENIVVNKKWSGGTKTEIEVALYRSINGGAATLYRIEKLNSDNEWSCRWDGLTVEEGNETEHKTYTYAVREVKTPAGYSSNMVYDIKGDTTTVTITNTYDDNCDDEYYYIVNVLQTDKLNISKTWEDDGDVAGLRPENLTITVNDGKGGSYPVTLDQSNSWSKTLTVLKKKDATYSATEETVMNYTSQDNSQGKNISFTNTLQSTSVTVKKEWNDGNNIAARPDGIQFELKYKAKNGDDWETYGTYSLLEEDVVYDESGEVSGDWQKTISGLPAQYEYKVEEINVSDGYHSSVEKSDDDTNTFTITNTLNWSLKKTNSPESGETAVALQGATFELKQGNILIATGTSGENGMVAWESMEDSSTDQKYDLQNLNGEYVLTETKAPSGYQRLQTASWKLTFSNGLLTNAEGSDEKFDTYISQANGNATDGIVVTLKNDLLYELPETGGSGIYWYTLSGALLMMGAALIVYKQQRKREVLLRR